MNNDVTFLISSCDKYEDAWNPFFKLLSIYTKDCEFTYPIVLNTETKKYSCSEWDIRVINSSTKLTWSERMLYVLERIETDYVFLLLEDFFIQSPFNYEQFDKVVQYMRDHDDVGVIHTTPTGKKYEPTTEMFFERKFSQNNICVTAVLWRKAFLQQLLRKHENIWEFEWYSGMRAPRYPYKVMQYNEMYPVIFDYRVVISDGYGLVQGKWLKKNEELFEKHGITVDFENLGWYNPEEKAPVRISFFKRVIRHIQNRIKRYKSLR